MVGGVRLLRARDWVRPLSAWILAVVVVSAALMAGRSYLWCVPMQRTMTSCCEGSADPAALDGAAPSVRRGCCDGRTVGALPAAASQGAVLSLPSAALAFVTLAAQPALLSVAPRRDAARELGALASARAGPIRAGPTRASRTCAALQVFRC